MATRRRKWSGKVKTVSTRPPKNLFTKDAATIARTMARRSVSPKGAGSGVRMIAQGPAGIAETRAREGQEAPAGAEREGHGAETCEAFRRAKTILLTTRRRDGTSVTTWSRYPSMRRPPHDPSRAAGLERCALTSF